MGQFAIPLIMSAVSAGVQMHNTNRTARKQDEAQAMALRRQGEIQGRADDRVGQEVTKLEQSRSESDRQQRMDQYMQQLSRGRDKMLAGFSPVVGSDAFKQDSLRSGEAVERYAGDNAGLMARIDAPGMQRQGEAFGFGHLATDIGMLGRESQGTDFIDQLRASRIRRNPWMDAGAQVIGGLGQAYGAGAGTASSTGWTPGAWSQTPGGWVPGNSWRNPSPQPIRLPGG